MANHHEKVDMLLIYGQAQRSGRRAVRLYQERYPDRPVPNHKIFGRLERQLRNNENAFSSRKNVPIAKSVCNDLVVAEICQFFENNPRASLNSASLQLNLPYSTIRRTLKKCGYFPYKLHNLQRLTEENRAQRLYFLADMAVLENDCRRIYGNILWTDESRFVSNGLPNKQNERYWSSENPHFVNEVENQGHFGVNVWCGIIGRHLIGPYFYDYNFDGIRFLQFLQLELPNLLQDVRQNFWFQMDGAPCHNAAVVTEYMNATFPNRWIGRSGPIHWPAKSPDLTTLDFFLWGTLKNIVYRTPTNNVEHLKEKIRDACNSITPETLRTVTSLEVRRRFERCLEADGGQFEHML